MTVYKSFSFLILSLIFCAQTATASRPCLGYLAECLRQNRPVLRSLKPALEEVFVTRQRQITALATAYPKSNNVIGSQLFETRLQAMSHPLFTLGLAEMDFPSDLHVQHTVMRPTDLDIPKGHKMFLSMLDGRAQSYSFLSTGDTVQGLYFDFTHDKQPQRAHLIQAALEHRFFTVSGSGSETVITSNPAVITELDDPELYPLNFTPHENPSLQVQILKRQSTVKNPFKPRPHQGVNYLRIMHASAQVAIISQALDSMEDE